MAARRKQQRAKADEQQDSQGQAPEQAESQDIPELDEEATQNLQKQLSRSLRPVVSNLQQQISQAVQQRLGQSNGASVETNGTQETGLEGLGSIGETIQSAMDAVVDIIKRIWAWINEKIEGLGDKLAELLGALAGKMVQKAIRSAF